MVEFIISLNMVFIYAGMICSFGSCKLKAEILQSIHSVN